METDFQSKGHMNNTNRFLAGVTAMLVLSTTSAYASACFDKLTGSWEHPIGGTWIFANGKKAELTVNSTNYGPAAQQITEFAVASCENNTMTYKIVRGALVNTVDPSFAYDKTQARTPAAFNWAKEYQQPYEISGRTFKFGNFTYTKQ